MLTAADLFLAAGALDPHLAALAIAIGLVAVPASFLARRLAHRLSGTAHLRMPDAVVVPGGLLLLCRALGQT
ncbi:MAG: hypothetical protein R3D84_17575 [Paracoccaceae bacterium]